MQGLAPDLTTRIARDQNKALSAFLLATMEAIAKALDIPLGKFFAVGDYVISASDERLAQVVKRLTGLSKDDLDWADRLLTVALSRKQTRS